MAIVWQKRTAQKRYQVRSAGRTVRLYTDGVFHSQYNPAHGFRGSLWDMLALPCLALKEDCVDAKGLILGVGGGAVMRYVQGYRSWRRMTGVDLDKQHLHIAEQFFGVHGRGIELIEDDAVRFVGRAGGERVDYLVDDLFGEEHDATGLPIRAVKITQGWLHALSGRLTDQGVLVFNVESHPQARQAVRALKKVGGFNSVFYVANELYHNVIVACLKQPFTRQQFLRSWQSLRGARPLPCKVTFQQLTNV